jgi:hypothetical protein
LTSSILRTISLLMLAITGLSSILGLRLPRV